MKVDEKKEDNLFNGFYERIGTVQYVKGIAVDTVYYKDLEDSPAIAAARRANRRFAQASPVA